MFQYYIKAIVLPVSIFVAITASSQFAQHPKPTDLQLQWANMEYYLFVHFGPNTFTGLEWGEGKEKEEIFNPTALDCRQW